LQEQAEQASAAKKKGKKGKGGSEASSTVSSARSMPTSVEVDESQIRASMPIEPVAPLKLPEDAMQSPVPGPLVSLCGLCEALNDGADA